MAEKMTLLPCPFCGAPAAKNKNPGDRWVYYCPNGHTGYLRHKEWQVRSHIAQPAQAVDVGAIREVISELRDWPAPDRVIMADKLTRALSGEKAGPVDGPIAETFGGWCNTLTHAYMYVTEGEPGNAHYGIEKVLNDLREWQRKLSPAFPAPDKEGI